MSKNKEAAELCIDFLYRFINKLSRPSETFVRPKISPTYLTIISYLHEYGEKTMGEIAQFMSVSRQQMTQNIDKMEKCGYVVRKSSARDRRLIIVSCTQKGEDMLRECRSLLRTKFEAMFSDMDDDKLDRMYGLMSDMKDLLDVI